jgi:hypothetical protein
MYWFKIFSYCLLLALLVACQNPQQAKNQIDPTYYNLDSLVQQQAYALHALGARLEKHVQMNKEQERVTLKPDSLGWTAELGMFSKANIDKPILWDTYEIIGPQPDTNSNLTTIQYLAKSPRAAIQSLTVYYLKSPRNLRRITTSLHEKNALYRSGMQLEMHFDEFTEGNRLVGFRTEGFQKMKTQDSLILTINGRVLYD